jgi:hypothetical protein
MEGNWEHPLFEVLKTDNNKGTQILGLLKNICAPPLVDVAQHRESFRHLGVQEICGVSRQTLAFQAWPAL